MTTNIYSQSATDIQGNTVSLEQYRGKVLLIVNTASECGFTPQYKGLEALYQEYKDQGLVILGFPCNQFGAQEPGSDEEIAEFCDLSFKTSFPLFSKIDVNGSSAHPLFSFLKEEAPGLLGSKKIKWNFTKFLVKADGSVLKRYAPQDKPSKIALELAELLN